MAAAETGFIEPPQFVVNLNLPASERWKHVLKATAPNSDKSYAHLFRDVLDYVHEVALSEFGGVGVGPAVVWTLQNVAAIISRAVCRGNKPGGIPSYFREELEGIASYTGPLLGFGYDQLVLLNIGYDLLARCTSAVVEEAASDAVPSPTPVHLRNMDWDCEPLRKMTVDCSFQRSGVTVYRATTWVGMVGLSTCWRTPDVDSKSAAQSGFSMSVNFRCAGGSLLSNVVQGLRGAWPLTFLFRQVCETCSTYDQAVARVCSAPLIAPAYVTIAGPQPGQGCVLTRDRRSVAIRMNLADQLYLKAGDAKPLGRFVSQTNCDFCPGKPPLTGDALVNWAAGDVLLLSATERREAFEFALRQTFEARRAYAGTTRPGKEDKKRLKNSVLSLDSFFFPLALAPVCNVQTNYSCVISPGEQSYESRLLLKPADTARCAAAALSTPLPDSIKKGWDGGFAAPAAAHHATVVPLRVIVTLAVVFVALFVMKMRS